MSAKALVSDILTSLVAIELTVWFDDDFHAASDHPITY